METEMPKRRLWTNQPIKRMISSNHTIKVTNVLGTCSVLIKGKKKEAVIM